MKAAWWKRALETWRIGTGDTAPFTRREDTATLEVLKAMARIRRRGQSARFALCDTGSAGERIVSVHRSLMGARLERQGRGRGVVRVVSHQAQAGWPSRDFTEVEACVNVWLAGRSSGTSSVDREGVQR